MRLRCFLPSEHETSTNTKETVRITLTTASIRARVWKTPREPRKTLQENESRRNTSAIARINLHSLSDVSIHNFFYM